MTVTFFNLSREEREAIHGMCRQMFSDGECYTFAIALHRGLGWPIVGLIMGSIVRHAAVKSPEGNFLDVRGVVTAEELVEPFGSPDEIRVVTEEDLAAIRPIQERAVENAITLIEKMWPDLPGWHLSDYRRRVAGFMEELEGLSRKYNIFIRAPFPSCHPVLSDAIGDEAGYVLSPTVNSHEFLFDRQI